MYIIICSPRELPVTVYVGLASKHLTTITKFVRGDYVSFLLYIRCGLATSLNEVSATPENIKLCVCFFYSARIC